MVARALAVLAYTLLLGACATTPFNLQPALNGEILPGRAEISETPFFPQTRFHCGPAALSTVLNHHGADTSPALLAEHIYIPGLKGSLQAEVVAAARVFELLVIEQHYDLPSLLKEVAAGRPVLVMQNLGLKWLPRWHYAVVVGYDLADQTIVLRSGKRQRWVTPLNVFDRTWQRADRWALLVSPPTQRPSNVAATAFINAASILESAGHTRAAHRAYQTAAEHWPDDGLAHFGLGNTAYALGDYYQATEAFTERVRLAPQSPDGWNNLAYSLTALGCGTQAIEAAQCAVRLAPEDDNYRDTLTEINALATSLPPLPTSGCNVPFCP